MEQYLIQCWDSENISTLKEREEAYRGIKMFQKLSKSVVKENIKTKYFFRLESFLIQALGVGVVVGAQYMKRDIKNVFSKNAAGFIGIIITIVLAATKWVVR